MSLSCATLFPSTVLLLTVILPADGLQLTSKVATVLSKGNAQSSLGNTTKERAAGFFEDSSREPNKWNIFSAWSCNNPAAQSAYATAPYSKMKVGGRNVSGILVFGGRLFQNGLDQYYGTWYYDMDENLWQSVSASNAPENRKGHIMITLCHTTVLVMGGKVLDLKTTNFRPVNDLWLFSDRKGTWQELMEDCEETSCSRLRPKLLGATARVIEQSLSPCHCKESVLVFEADKDMSTVWELRCIEDKESYSWQNFSSNATKNRGFKFVDKLTASSVDDSLVYAVTADGVWQYSHKITGWCPMSLNDNNSSTTNNSHWFPSIQDLQLVDQSLFLDDGQQLLLFGRALINVLVFNPANHKWKLEPVVGTPPPHANYFVSVIGSTVLWYGGNEGGCRQLVWTLKRSSDANIWYWTPVRTPAIEAFGIVERTTVLVGSDLYMRGFLEKPRNTTHSAQLWNLDLNTMQWWQRRDRQPALMYGGAMATTSHQSAIIMAGKTSYSNFDTWMYSLAPNNWLKLVSPRELKQRQMHSFVRVRKTEFILFGGFDRPRVHSGGRTVAGDIWLFNLNLSDPKSSQWKHAVPNNNHRFLSTTGNDRITPSPRYFHSVVVINSTMFLFGGRSQSRNCLYDLWSLDIDTFRWSLVTPNNEGPRPTRLNYCFSSAAAVGPHLLVTTGCSPSFRQRHPVDCNTGNVQQTWLYLPHLSKWSFVDWIRDINTNFDPATFLFRDYILMAEVQRRVRLHYLFPQCPDGLASSDIKKLPCEPCPIGKFTASSRDRCETCPEGLTTPTVGSSTIFNCSVCKPGSCINGECLIHQVNGRPSPVCRCTVGFTGTNCSLPTYYIIALAVLFVTILIVCGTCGICWLRRRKKQREAELRRQVRELTSAWQVSFSELTIHNRIGAGGFGEVYKAHYRDLTVAVKFLRSLTDEGVSQEFEREIRFMQTIRHPNIVLFIGAGKEEARDASPFLITEYVQRGSLRGILDQSDIELSSKQRVEFAADAACGMNFLHTQEPARIHRDLKSDNLLVSSNWVVKVADFGLGRQLPRRSSPQMPRRRMSVSSPLLGDQLQMTGCGIGAARWRAPELVMRSTDYGTAVDVYSFGIVMWEIWSRQLPFLQYRFNYLVEDAVLRGERPPALEDSPQVYSNLMQKCWQHDPQLRPAFSDILQTLQFIYST